MRMREKQLKIIGSLRRNGRASFSGMGREHGFPVTTVYDNYNQLLARGVVRRHTSLVDFKSLGFGYRSFVFVKAGPEKNSKEVLLDFLRSHPSVNSISRINGYDFLVDGVFRGMREFYVFLESLEGRGISALEHHDVIAPVKLEGFGI